MSNIQSLIAEAWAKRSEFHQKSDTNAYRVFHGYDEGLAGISIDRYDTCAIINKKAPLDISDTELTETLLGLHDFDTIVLKTHQRISESSKNRVRFLHGSSKEPLKVLEDGIHYYADHLSLHTNGLYLDARPVRRWLRANSESRRILNLFAHTGSLGIPALLGGAKEVVHLDKNKNVVDKIKLNYLYNDLKPDDRGMLIGDLYFHLPRAIKFGQKFSGIILDPPPLVPPPPKAPKHRPVGQDFATLMTMCCKLLQPDAWLVCIYHEYKKSHEEHDQAIVDASEHTLKPVWQAVCGEDFPESDPNRKTRMTAFRLNNS